jgi:hypothetical protein
VQDAELAELAQDYADVKARIKRLESKADGLKRKIVGEMQGRDTKGIITGGLKITLVEQTTVTYDERRLKRALGNGLWDRATSVVLDRDKLAALVQEGEVDVTKVNRCATVTPKAAYPVVSKATDD